MPVPLEVKRNQHRALAAKGTPTRWFLFTSSRAKHPSTLLFRSRLRQSRDKRLRRVGGFEFWNAETGGAGAPTRSKQVGTTTLLTEALYGRTSRKKSCWWSRGSATVFRPSMTWTIPEPVPRSSLDLTPAPFQAKAQLAARPLHEASVACRESDFLWSTVEWLHHLDAEEPLRRCRVRVGQRVCRRGTVTGHEQTEATVRP